MHSDGGAALVLVKGTGGCFWKANGSTTTLSSAASFEAGNIEALDRLNGGCGSSSTGTSDGGRFGGVLGCAFASGAGFGAFVFCFALPLAFGSGASSTSSPRIFFLVRSICKNHSGCATLDCLSCK